MIIFPFSLIFGLGYHYTTHCGILGLDFSISVLCLFTGCGSFWVFRLCRFVLSICLSDFHIVLGIWSCYCSESPFSIHHVPPWWFIRQVIHDLFVYILFLFFFLFFFFSYLWFVLDLSFCFYFSLDLKFHTTHIFSPCCFFLCCAFPFFSLLCGCADQQYAMCNGDVLRIFVLGPFLS